MPKTVSHHIEKRTFHGETLGAPVAAFLNRYSGAGADRVLELFGLLRKLGVFGYGLNGIWATTKERMPEFCEVIAEINRRMERYKVVRLLWPSTGPMAALLKDTYVRECQFRNVPSSQSVRALAECEAALRLADLADMGLLGSLRHCECEHPRGRGQWFFARFAHQRFCSDECRVRFNETTPQARAYRAKKSREYYHLHKSGKVRER